MLKRLLVGCAPAVVFLASATRVARAQAAFAPQPAVRSPQSVWNSPRTDSLVRRATELRARQLADTGLVNYRATARGYLTFLAQLGTGELGQQQFPEPPRIVKSDELALERSEEHTSELQSR